LKFFSQLKNKKMSPHAMKEFESVWTLAVSMCQPLCWLAVASRMTVMRTETITRENKTLCASRWAECSKIASMDEILL